MYVLWHKKYVAHHFCRYNLSPLPRVVDVLSNILLCHGRGLWDSKHSNPETCYSTRKETGSLFLSAYLHLDVIWLIFNSCLIDFWLIFQRYCAVHINCNLWLLVIMSDYDWFRVIIWWLSGDYRVIKLIDFWCLCMIPDWLLVIMSDYDWICVIHWWLWLINGDYIQKLPENIMMEHTRSISH